MNNKFVLSALIAIAIMPMFAGTAFAGDYYGAYPDEIQIDADKIYMTSDFDGVSSTVTNNVFAVMSAANAETDDDLTGYISQLFIVYDDATDDLEMHSEVHGITSSGSADDPYDCEDVGNTCKDFGNASNIEDVDSVMYWYSGDIKYYSFVDIKVGSDTYGYNTNYDPDSNNQESPTQFQSGVFDDGIVTYKLVQWGIESNTLASADNWTIELSGMKTYDGSYSNFVDDTAVSTDFTSGYDDGSYMTFRDVNGNINLRVGESDYCVHRNGSTAGILELTDASSSCLAVPTTLWS